MVMDQNIGTMEGNKTKAVGDRDTASISTQSSPHSEAHRQIYVPPSILRLKTLSISALNTDPEEDPEQSDRDDNTLDEGTVAESEHKRGEEEQSHRECDEDLFPSEYRVTLQYVRDNVPAFCELADLRLKGWTNPEGEKYFEKQRYHTDNADLDTSQKFLKMMHNVAAKMEEATGVFTLPGNRPAILGFGFAPGGFLAKALKVNPTAIATGITLSAKDNGIPILIKDKRLTTSYADITLMAGDLGVLPDEIPADHPDANNFLPKQIRPRAQFDLVTSEGGVLRPHQVTLGSHREQREAHRLKASQLALALARVKNGGRMIVLMHKAEAWNSLCLFYLFSKFAKLRLFKPDREHQYKSSFYVIATDVQSQSEAARAAVQQWTREWRIATFGTDEEYQEEVRKNALDADVVLKEFGKEWIELGRDVWNLQLDGLKQKSFTQ